MIIKLIITLLLNACIKKRVYKKKRNREKVRLLKCIMGGASSNLFEEGKMEVEIKKAYKNIGWDQAWYKSQLAPTTLNE
jgi:hypothetical protein